MANTKITTAVIKDDAITTAKIADDAVTGALIADDVALAGNPTTTTQSAGNNTTRIATTAFVTTAINNLVDSAPSALDTLNELAAAMGDDANFSTTVTNSIATKLPLAGGTMTGDLTISSTAGSLTLVDSDGTNQNTIIKQSGGNLFIQARDNSNNAGIVLGGNGGGSFDEHLRIDGSGVFMVAKNSSSSNNVGFETSQTGNTSITRAGGQPLLLNRQTDDGDIILLRQAGTSIGSIQSRAGVVTTIVLNPASGNGAGLSGGTKAVVPADEAGIIDNDISLGVSTHRFKDLQLSGTANIGTQVKWPSASYDDMSMGLDSNGFYVYNNGDSRYQMILDDGSGNVAVGTTTALGKATNRTAFTVNGTSSTTLNIATGGNQRLYMYSDGTYGQVSTVGNIELRLGSDDTPRMRINQTSFIPHVDNNYDLGSTSLRWQNIYASSGIFLGGTGSANKLDDYEEGTWTPTLPNGGSLTNVGSNYTKIGRLVHITSYLQTITPTNNSSGFLIGGLPFTVWGSGYTYSAGSFSYIGTSSGNVNKFGLLASTGNSYLYFHYIDGTGGSGVTNAQWISEMGSGTGIHLIFHAFFYEDS